MKEKEVQLAKQLIENHRSFDLKQVEYQIEKSGSGDYHIRLWTTPRTLRTETFHNTEMIPTIQSYFSCYVDFNKDEARCELNIF